MESLEEAAENEEQEMHVEVADPTHGGKRRKSDAQIKEGALQDSALDEICAFECACPLQCSKRILSKQLVKGLHEKTFSFTPKERGNHIFEQMLSFAEDDEAGDRRICHKVEAARSCEDVWRIAHGYSRHHVENARRRIMKGKVSFRSPGRLGKKNGKVDRGGAAQIEAAAWIFEMAEALGDKMPTFDQIRVPYNSRVQVHAEYVLDMAKRRPGPARTVAVQTFCKIWRSDPKLKKVILTPPNSGFAECTICGSLRRRLEVPNLPKADYLRLRAERKQHLDLQRGERLLYVRHKEAAFRRPGECACVIFDGCELAKSTVPLLKREMKSTEGVPLNTRFVMRLIGVKLHHGGETKHFGYVVPPWVGGGGANAVCEILVRLIDEFGDKRPSALFIQVDNCSENKCKTLFAFCDWLVATGIFDSIQINYLVVGHTHEDIDQWFSTFSKAVHKQDIWTPNQMLELLAHMSEKDSINPKVVFVTSRHDYASWLAESIDPQLGYYSREPSPHEFLFTKIGGQVLMRYKPWGQSENYLPAAI